jgi:hypothetical protein
LLIVRENRDIGKKELKNRFIQFKNKMHNKANSADILRSRLIDDTLGTNFIVPSQGLGRLLQGPHIDI